MQALEIETTIDQQGNIRLSEAYRNFYGKSARLIVLIAETSDEKMMDPMAYSGTVDWPEDGIAYQLKVRDDWS